MELGQNFAWNKFTYYFYLVHINRWLHNILEAINICWLLLLLQQYGGAPYFM